jgi:membrane protein YdbS with pleckstrin-like domain
MGKRTGVSPQAAKIFYIFVFGLCMILSISLKYNSEALQFGAFHEMQCDSSEKHCKGDQAVFRVSFALVLFYALMVALSLFSESLHRGYWGFKIVLLLVGIIVSFFMPVQSFNVHAYAWVARVGSMPFLIMQILILIDFAYQWNEDWIRRAYDGEDTVDSPINSNWLYAIIASAAGLFICSLVGIVLLFVFYASCDVGVAFTVVTLISAVIVTVVSVFRDRLADVEFEGAILPTAVVIIYLVYLCWSALESNPNPKCRPKDDHDVLALVFGSIWTTFALMWSAFSVTSNAANLVTGDALAKVGTADVEGGAPVLQSDLEASMLDGEEDAEDIPVYSNEQAWAFHLIMLTASLYLAMLLTDWGTFKSAGSAGEASMWVKIVAQWLTGGLFVWTLIAPAVLRDRDFN